MELFKGYFPEGPVLEFLYVILIYTIFMSPKLRATLYMQSKYRVKNSKLGNLLRIPIAIRLKKFLNTSISENQIAYLKLASTIF